MVLSEFKKKKFLLEKTTNPVLSCYITLVCRYRWPHPTSCLKPRQPMPFDAEEHRLYSWLPQDLQAPHPSIATP